MRRLRDRLLARRGGKRRRGGSRAVQARGSEHLRSASGLLAGEFGEVVERNRSVRNETSTRLHTLELAEQQEGLNAANTEDR